MPKTSVTIRDVALRAGVSKSAVSAAFTGNGRLSEETRAVILQTAQQMGFEPNLNAQRLQSKGVSDLIGLFTLDLDLSVGTRKIKLIRHQLTVDGFNVQIHSCGYKTESVPRELRVLRQQRPRAIICNNMDLPDEALVELQSFQESGGVVVSYDKSTALPCDNVIFDRTHNTHLAAKHLLELGHRHIGFFKIGHSGAYGERLQGFKAALAEYGLAPRSEWLFETQGTDEFEHDGARMAAHFLSLKEKPSAVCIVNDYAALAFIAEVQRAGLHVPHDVAVVGHDDRPIARYCEVPLTTVSQPIETIAAHVVGVLEARLREEAPASFQREVVRGELIVRASSGPPVH